MLTLFRRGRITTADVEAQLDAIGAETAELRAQVDAIRAQDDLTQAYEAHLGEASAMLARLGERLAEIERTNDWDQKRQVVEMLVSRIGVRTETEGPSKSATVTIRYAFREPQRAVVSPRNAGVSSPPESHPGG